VILTSGDADCQYGTQFKELNSLLNRQVAEYETNLKASTHTLSESTYAGPAFSPSGPSSAVEAEAYSHRLGGGGGQRWGDEDTPQARRGRVLAATLRRLEKEEQEIEDMCGSGAVPSTTTGTAEARNDPAAESEKK